MKVRAQGVATPVALLVISLLLFLGALILLPHAAGGLEIRRPPRPTVMAAIQRRASETINGRITRVSSAGFTVRMLMGSKKVVALRRTRYLGVDAKSLPKMEVRKGDRVIVVGYPATDELLATLIRDTSRKL